MTILQTGHSHRSVCAKMQFLLLLMFLHIYITYYLLMLFNSVIIIMYLFEIAFPPYIFGGSMLQ